MIQITAYFDDHHNGSAQSLKNTMLTDWPIIGVITEGMGSLNGQMIYSDHLDGCGNCGNQSVRFGPSVAVAAYEGRHRDDRSRFAESRST